MKKKKKKMINKQNATEKAENKVDFADNLADSTPKEQTTESISETDNQADPETPDNVSEELEKLKDSYVRLMAEYDNYRKRTIKEKADLIKNGGEKTLVALLPVIDDFERAMQTIETASDITSLKEGVALIYNKFTTYLQQNGIKKIEALEQAFDFDLHEAVAMIPSPEEDQKGKIIDTVQTGYTLNDKVIRHAKVVVAN
jgi:molecular chaperone GrpE